MRWVSNVSEKLPVYIRWKVLVAFNKYSTRRESVHKVIPQIRPRWYISVRENKLRRCAITIPEVLILSQIFPGTECYIAYWIAINNELFF